VYVIGSVGVLAEAFAAPARSADKTTLASHESHPLRVPVKQDWSVPPLARDRLPPRQELQEAAPYSSDHEYFLGMGPHALKLYFRFRSKYATIR
jgi:hypothetical protein